MSAIVHQALIFVNRGLHSIKMVDLPKEGASEAWLFCVDGDPLVVLDGVLMICDAADVRG